MQPAKSLTTATTTTPRWALIQTVGWPLLLGEREKKKEKEEKIILQVGKIDKYPLKCSRSSRYFLLARLLFYKQTTDIILTR